MIPMPLRSDVSLQGFQNEDSLDRPILGQNTSNLLLN